MLPSVQNDCRAATAAGLCQVRNRLCLSLKKQPQGTPELRKFIALMYAPLNLCVFKLTDIANSMPQSAHTDFHTPRHWLNLEL